MSNFWIGISVFAIILVCMVIYDVTQKKHAILRNFPIIGHFRYWLEAIGPELRQYIVTSNNEERPFNRDQRSWVYASSKRENNYFGFGSDNEMETVPNYLIIKHKAFPLNEPHPGDELYDPDYRIPFSKILGGYRNRKKAFRPDSAIVVSAMSYGSLSARAVEAINRGCQIAHALHNTGEGGVSIHHKHGGDLIWQIGTGYFGCRDEQGKFDLKKLLEVVEKNPHIKALEIKLSQGAKPGVGGILPAAKITQEISNIRGIPMGRDCLSPNAHTAFKDADSLLDFVEELAEKTGLPVGVKSAVGELDFWRDLARLCSTTNRAMDYLLIDGGEGGTGAAPLVFSDRVSLPFKQGFSRVYLAFAEHGLHEKMIFGGAGKLGFPETALFGFALGCDFIAIAREPLLSIGCIQAQRCHTGHCPTGITTHNPWLVRGLDPTFKGARLANYLITLRKELLSLSRTCGHLHPAMISSSDFEILDERFGSSTIEQLFGYSSSLGLPSIEDQDEIKRIMSLPVSERYGSERVTQK